MKKRRKIWITVCFLLALWGCQQEEEKEEKKDPQEEFYAYEIYMDEQGEEAVCIQKYLGNELEVRVPEELEEKPVRKLGEEVFEAVYEVILPDSLYEIGEEAFFGSTVKKVHMGEGIKKIGQSAFKDCYLLEEVRTPHSQEGLSSLPHSIEEIGAEAFRDCWSLRGMELPKNVLRISSYAFSKCIQLEKVIIHEQTEEVEYAAFSGCFNLKEVEIKGEGLKRVGTTSFEDCPLLKTVPLPPGAVYEEGF
ncbi:leucine-rich repeat domain-containing protein [bacterium 1XD42-8]|jgi:hypothetical protein|nr:leucine-rich repeat domain-containing protein [Lachnospiraceae bacterium]RKJ32471.1 leucine-rich repeat domain-containing protein [bacterium 1XD42-8]